MVKETALVCIVLAAAAWLLLELTSPPSPPPRTSSPPDSQQTKTLHREPTPVADRELVGSLPELYVATGHDPGHVLRGRTQSFDGTPVKDLTIRLRWIALAEWNQEYALDERVQVTNTDGEFVFTNGTLGLAKLEVLKNDTILHETWIDIPRNDKLLIEIPSSSNALDQAPVNLMTGATVQIELINPDGTLAANAEVSLQDSRKVRVAQTNARGVALFTHMPLGHYKLSAYSKKGTTRTVPDFDFSNQHQGIDIQHEHEFLTETVRLIPWAWAGGQACDKDGSPIAGCRIIATGDAVRYKVSVGSTGEDGRFRIPITPGKTYGLKATYTRFVYLEKKRMEFPALEPGEECLDHFVEAIPSVPIRINVRDEQGRAIANAHISSVIPPGLMFSSNSRDYVYGEIDPFVTRSDGQMNIAVPPQNWYLLLLQHHDKHPSKVFFDLREEPYDPVEETVTLADLPHSTLSGIILDNEGQPIPRAHIKARPGDGKEAHLVFPQYYDRYQPMLIRHAMSREDGRFGLSGIEDGHPYTLSVEAPPWAKISVGDIYGGDQYVTISMSSLDAIEGYVLAEDGELIDGVTIECGDHESTTNKQGYFKLEYNPTSTRILVNGDDIFYRYIQLHELEFPIIVKKRPRQLGQLVDPQGNPLEMTQISIECRSQSRHYLHGKLHISTGRDGQFEARWEGYEEPVNNMVLLCRDRYLPDPGWDPVLAENFTISSQPIELQFREKGQSP